MDSLNFINILEIIQILNEFILLVNIIRIQFFKKKIYFIVYRTSHIFFQNVYKLSNFIFFKMVIIGAMIKMNTSCNLFGFSSMDGQDAAISQLQAHLSQRPYSCIIMILDSTLHAYSWPWTCQLSPFPKPLPKSLTSTVPLLKSCHLNNVVCIISSIFFQSFPLFYGLD